MRKRPLKRILSLVMAMVLCLAMLPPLTASAAGDAMSMDAVKALVNSETLYPQRTGYAALDALLEEIFAPYENSDNYTKLKAAYDWTVRNIDYSWEGYVEQVYDGFAIAYPYDDYEYGLQESIPYEVAARSYHTLSAHKGVCYDWGALLAVMLRYVGFEAYVHTGYFVFEAGYGTGSGMHGWTEVVLGGQYYIFDPQRDYRMSANGTGTIPYNYFGISYANAWRYTEDTAANATRDAGFLAVTAQRTQQVTVYAEASRSGSVTGGGTYLTGETAVLTAPTTTGKSFLGWYLTDGTLLSTSPVLSFTVSESVAVSALFEGDIYYDIPAGSWYLDAVETALAAGILNGDTIRFDADLKLSRGEVVTMLARASGIDTSIYTICPFTDLPADTETASAIRWAWQYGLIAGVTDTTFASEKLISRQDFIVILMRYLALQGVTAQKGAVTYTDSADIAGYALDSVAEANALGLVTGFEDGSLHPTENIDRAAGVSLIVRATSLLDIADEAVEEAPEKNGSEAAEEAAEETNLTESDEEVIEDLDDAA